MPDQPDVPESGLGGFAHRAAERGAQGALFGFFQLAAEQFRGAREQFAIQLVRQRRAFGQLQDLLALFRADGFGEACVIGEMVSGEGRLEVI